MNILNFHLAQASVALARGAPDSTVMHDFVMLSPTVHALADHAPGFVWRPDGPIPSFILDGRELMMTISVWRSVDALTDFVYSGTHGDALRRRKEWFVKLDGPYSVAWWVPEGVHPTAEEAGIRLTLLRRDGPTPGAFPLSSPFPKPRT